MNNTPIPTVFLYDSDSNSEYCSFRVRWETTATNTQQFEIHSERGNFELSVEPAKDKFHFSFSTAKSNFTLLQNYKLFSFQKPDSDTWRHMALLYQFFGRYSTDHVVPSTMIPSIDDHYDVEIRLSTVSCIEASLSEVTYPAIMMERFFRDISTYDVFFEFKADPLDINDTDQSHQVKTLIVGAHKFVICQWPYFKAMFESEFFEGGTNTGTKWISITGIKPKTFHMMVKFMYVGYLCDEISTLYESDTDRASWEGLYIAADRYRIDDLRKLALATIEKNLDSAAAIDFLFWTGYLYKELRDMLVKNIAKEYHAEIAKKQFKDAHRDHPEFAELMCELYDAYHNLCDV